MCYSKKNYESIPRVSFRGTPHSILTSLFINMPLVIFIYLFILPFINLCKPCKYHVASISPSPMCYHLAPSLVFTFFLHFYDGTLQLLPASFYEGDFSSPQRRKQKGLFSKDISYNELFNVLLVDKGLQAHICRAQAGHLAQVFKYKLRFLFLFPPHNNVKH